MGSRIKGKNEHHEKETIEVKRANIFLIGERALVDAAPSIPKQNDIKVHNAIK